MRVAHVPLDFRPRHQRRHRVDHHDVHRVAAHQDFSDLKRFLADPGLGDQQIVDIHSTPGRIGRIEGMLGIDQGGRSAVLLGLGDNVLGQRRLTRSLGPKHLDHPTARQSAYAEGEIQGDGARRHHAYLGQVIPTHAENRTSSELLLDLRYRGL